MQEEGESVIGTCFGDPAEIAKTTVLSRSWGVGALVQPSQIVASAW